MVFLRKGRCFWSVAALCTGFGLETDYDDDVNDDDDDDDDEDDDDDDENDDHDDDNDNDADDDDDDLDIKLCVSSKVAVRKWPGVGLAPKRGCVKMD